MNRLITILLLWGGAGLSAQPVLDFPADPAPFCTEDPLLCETDITLSFIIYFQDPASATVSYVIRVDGGEEMVDPYGSLVSAYPVFHVEGIYPVGDYEVIVTATDGEGYQAGESLSFSVVDCAINDLACPEGLSWPGSYFLTGSCYQTVHVFDLVPYLEFLNDCSGSLNFAVYPAAFDPVEFSPVIELCTEGGDLLEIRMWDNAWNPYAVQPDGSLGGPNYRYCNLLMIYSGPSAGQCLCDELPSVSGWVRTENGSGVANVNMELSGHLNGSQLTDGEGYYHWQDLNANFSYTLTPNKEDALQNGVTTFDLALIAKHILNEFTLDSPYKLIAADINNNGNITVLDIILLRKIILGTLDEIPGNSSWRFVDAAYVFPDPANPWLEVYPEVIHLNQLQEDLTGLDFIAVKIGDVNGTAATE